MFPSGAHMLGIVVNCGNGRRAWARVCEPETRVRYFEAASLHGGRIDSRSQKRPIACVVDIEAEAATGRA